MTQEQALLALIADLYAQIAVLRQQLAEQAEGAQPREPVQTERKD